MLGGRNKQRSQPLGYTIVEVMIVLAVSAVMFLIAANFINGKQEKAAFAQGSNDTASKLQNIVEDITDGHYSDVPLWCVPFGGRLYASTSSFLGTKKQGESSSCVFLGKIVRFYGPGAGGSGDKSNYGVYSIAAARDISDFPTGEVGAISGLTTESVIPQSLYVRRMTITDTNSPPTTYRNFYNIGFVQGIGNTSPGDPGVYLSGAQQPVQLVYARTNSSNETDIAGTTIQPARSATICLTDGVRYAQILIGGMIPGGGASSNNGNRLNISVQQLGTSRC